MTKAMAGRTALITGASRGIGRAAALALAGAGAHVILVARTTGGLEETDDAIQKIGGTATLVPMNLRDFDAIDRLGASIYERWGKLDAMLGNAGVLGTLTPLAQITPKGFAEVMEVNVTANWRLIRSMDPLLRQSDAGRVLFVSSGAAKKHTTYAAECRETNLKVNLLNPGPMRTAMRAKAMPGEDPATLPTPDEIAPQIVEMLSPSFGESETIANFRR
jgi:NAD(P)-dependent dehydrogenase (short-subunit alcohol dehydrogenase family)